MSATETAFETVGEQLAGRVLEREVRAGVEHYAPGQWHTTLHIGGKDFFSGESLDIGRITYVDQMGRLCVVLTMRKPSLTGAWRATWVSRAGLTFKSEPREIRTADEFPLTEKMLAALDAAQPSPWPSAASRGAAADRQERS